MPIKGQLSFLLPQEEIDYMTVGNGGLYMFPRKDGILLGGTFKRNDWTTTPTRRTHNASLPVIASFLQRWMTPGLELLSGYFLDKFLDKKNGGVFYLSD